MSFVKSSFLTMVLSLGGFAVFAGVLLGAVYTITEKPIEEARARSVNDAIAEVAPAFTNNPSAQAVSVAQPDGHTVVIYPAFNADTLCGAAVESYSLSGFSGEISVMYGFDAEGAVTGYRVLAHAETPGLGARMDEWFRSGEGTRSVIGLNPSTRRAYVSKDGGDVDGITAATITSRAFLDALRRAHEAFIQYRDTIQ